MFAIIKVSNNVYVCIGQNITLQHNAVLKNIVQGYIWFHIDPVLWRPLVNILYFFCFLFFSK